MLLASGHVERFNDFMVKDMKDESKYYRADKLLEEAKSYVDRHTASPPEGKTAEEVLVENVGKVDPRRHLEAGGGELMSSSIVQCLGTMLDTVVF